MSYPLPSLIASHNCPPRLPTKKEVREFRRLPRSIHQSTLDIFQWRIRNWFDQLQKNPAAKGELLRYFLNLSHLPDRKLKKSARYQDGIELCENHRILLFSILAFPRQEGEISYSLVSDVVIGEPGGTGRVKLALPLIYNPEDSSITIVSYRPHLVKIMRHEILNDIAFPMPSPDSRELMHKVYGADFGYMERFTTSTKAPSQGAASTNVKKYEQLPLFEGIDMLAFMNDLVLKRQFLTAEQLFEIIFQVLDEVEIVHGNGFVHRDIKPENFIVDPLNSKVKLIDYDSCAREGSNAPFFGTHTYYSTTKFPNNFCIEHVERQRDLYAIGKTILNLFSLVDQNKNYLLSDTLIGLAGILLSGGYKNIEDFRRDLIIRGFSRSEGPESIRPEISPVFLTLKLQ